MAEIHIQKKKKPLWPWILGLIFLAGIAWLVIDFPNDRPTSLDPGTVGITDNASADQESDLIESENINDFVYFVNENDAVHEMDLDHNYTSEGIRLLAVALNDLAEKVDSEDSDLLQKKNDFMAKANYIQQDASSIDHADTIRSAFQSAADLMNDLQENHFPDLSDQVAQVKETAENIDPKTQTLNQRAYVQAFFASSSQALQSMNEELKK